MISSQIELEVSIEQLNRMYRALALLRAETPPGSPQYELFAEGPWDEIEKLRAEIDEYLARPGPIVNLHSSHRLRENLTLLAGGRRTEGTD